MQLEVEQKFPVADRAALEARIAQLGLTLGEPVEQVDTYYRHPARDFAQTDEALRIRRIGRQNLLTYKGPKLDATTKTRRELELPLPEGEDYSGSFAELLGALSFTPVAEVAKRRRTAVVEWQGWSIEIALDEVAEVGLFAELETTCDETSLVVGRERLASLAAHLGLSSSERRSYLEMLLTARNRLQNR